MLKTIWAVIATAATIALGILHFANPYPLIQVPDRGHRLYFVPASERATAVKLLAHFSDLKPFGTFTAGVRQTLFSDGVTVVATAMDTSRAGISTVTAKPSEQAEKARIFLRSRGVDAIIWNPPERELEGKLVVLKIPSFGWDLAFRIPGQQMPWPRWEK